MYLVIILQFQYKVLCLQQQTFYIFICVLCDLSSIPLDFFLSHTSLRSPAPPPRPPPPDKLVSIGVGSLLLNINHKVEKLSQIFKKPTGHLLFSILLRSPLWVGFSRRVKLLLVSVDSPVGNRQPDTRGRIEVVKLLGWLRKKSPTLLSTPKMALQ